MGPGQIGSTEAGCASRTNVPELFGPNICSPGQKGLEPIVHEQSGSGLTLPAQIGFGLHTKRNVWAIMGFALEI